MQSVRETSELIRVLSLPRRPPTPTEDLRLEMSDALRLHGSASELFALQALALHDIGTCGGGFLPLDVGEGKTLISLIVAYVLGARRPLLLLPAALIHKTDREREEYARDWPVPNNLRLMSYQMLGLVQAATELEVYQPDLIIADETQRLKNRDAAVTRRVARYMAAHPTTAFVGMTGTIMRKSIRDFGHIVRWALKNGAPVPATDAELDEWALALDEKVENEFARLDPGALLRFATPEDIAEYGEVVAARRGFRRRLRETPGVVCSAESGTYVMRVVDGEEVPVDLKIRALRYDLSSTTEGHFERLRNDKITPDGWELFEAVDVWRHSKELALGFHQIWDPRPPDDWREARREWFAFVRSVLAHSRTYDSPEHVAQACDAGRLPSSKLNAWRAIEPTFEYDVLAVWHDDSALRTAAEWMSAGPGIVWTEHVEFAHRLAEMTGAKYYGAKGFSSDGEFVDNADPTRSVIVSADANREGRNLQRKWFRNLVVSPEEGADLWQQLIGRTHRPGQTAPTVTVDVFLGCAEHAKAWSKACMSARSIRDTVGSESKLLIADVEWPSDLEIESWSGPRWGK